MRGALVLWAAIGALGCFESPGSPSLEDFEGPDGMHGFNTVLRVW